MTRKVGHMYVERILKTFPERLQLNAATDGAMKQDQ
jgi:hypothetical protein